MRSSSHAQFQFHRSHQIEFYNCFLPNDVEKYDLHTTSRRESNMQGHDHSDERLEEEMPFVVVFLVVGVCKFGCSQLVSLAWWCVLILDVLFFDSF